MLNWIRQGAAVVAPIEFANGQQAKVVLVGPRENPKGVVIVLVNAGMPATETRPFDAYMDQLPPETVANVLCMQERLFGQAGLPAPTFA